MRKWWDLSNTDTKDKEFIDSKTILGLDKYGFPPPALANSFLVTQEDFGDSTKELEKSWEEWLHYNPFDVSVAEKLTSLYRIRLAKLDQKNDSASRQLIERKLKRALQRAERYRKKNFTP